MASHLLNELVAWMDLELATQSIKDYPNALNGLQLANNGKISRVAAAVDASEGTIREAISAGADLLIVHHGLFWSGLQRHTGPAFRKLKLAIDNNLAIYSSHLPLDIHPELGNNAILSSAIGITDSTPALELGGIDSGLAGHFTGSWSELLAATGNALGGGDLLSWGFGPTPRRVLVCSGAAGSEIARAARLADTFITGEGPHWSVPLAEELGINLIYGGHYRTETFGVKALANALNTRFNIPWTFIDRPTGL